MRGTSTVYSGMLAGTGYRATGGGSDYVCLPRYPQHSTYKPGVQGYAKLVPAEYEVPVTGKGQNYNAPCAVCHTTRSDTMMIPARTTCYYGWTFEYVGYLRTERDKNAHSTKFICVDRNYEVISGSGGHTYATDLYHVEMDCSSGLTSCYQYNSYKELTCVVCSK